MNTMHKVLITDNVLCICNSLREQGGTHKYVRVIVRGSRVANNWINGAMVSPDTPFWGPLDLRLSK